MLNPADPLDDDFPTTAKVRRSTARRLRELRKRGGFASVDALLVAWCSKAERDPSLLLRGGAR